MMGHPTVAPTRALGLPTVQQPMEPAGAPQRIDSIDIVRGIVMVIMAIDHVRVYAGVPAGGATTALFFTRWITHIAAPAFVFLAGTAAYLHGQRLADRRALAQYLLTRGLFLALLELTVVRVLWTFNLDFGSYMLAGVIWMLGWCMVLMAAAVFLPMAAVAVTAIVIIAGHNLTDLIPAQIQALAGGTGSALLTLLYTGGGLQLGSDGPPLFVLYSIIPWIGVMMAGYAWGAVVQRPKEERRRAALRVGAAAVAAFVVLRYLDVYGDPFRWSDSDGSAVLAFLATVKYPASLLFLLMTLGPTLLLLGLSETWRGRVSHVFLVFGRVPLFYYVMHLLVIHAAAVLLSVVRGGSIEPWLFGNHPIAPGPPPEGYRWSLPLLYGIFTVCIAVLYLPCQWYARQRALRRSRWLSYL